MSDSFSPFAINYDNLTPEEQIQPEDTITENLKPLKLDLPTTETVVDEPAFETVEVKKREKISPEKQAEAVLNNYLTMHPNFYPSGQQRRTLYREFLRNAKKGKYEKIFNN